MLRMSAWQRIPKVREQKPEEGRVGLSLGGGLLVEALVEAEEGGGAVHPFVGNEKRAVGEES